MPIGIRLLFKYCVIHLLGTKLRLRYDYWLSNEIETRMYLKFEIEK
jgi:hypothetical protein